MTQWCPLVRANLSAARVGWAPDERVAKSKIFTSAEVWVIPVRETSVSHRNKPFHLKRVTLNSPRCIEHRDCPASNGAQ